MTTPSLPRFLTAMAIGFFLIWALLALWIMIAPLTIFNVGQAVVIAKNDLLKRCPASDIVVFGDSRADAGIDPRLIDRRTVNFAQGGGNIAEDYYRMKRYLTCGAKPNVAILSYILPEYCRVDPLHFWEGTAMMHLITLSERNEILSGITEANGADAFHILPGEPPMEYPFLPYKMRNLLFEVYFPLLFSSSMLHALENGIVFRYHDNVRVYDAAIANHGRSEYHALPHEPGPARDAALWTGIPSPVVDRHLRMLLAMLHQNGISAMLVVMPVNDATYSAMPAPMRESLMEYLNALPTLFSNLVVPNTDLPRWPERYFGDSDMHLNALGAAAVAGILKRCLAMGSGRGAAALCSL